ncbi:MAG: ABC transporter substrate-binding protein [Microbacteriaceae bacterium]
MRSRPLAAVAAVAVAAFALAGCSSSGGGTSADTGETSFVYAISEPDHLTPGRQTVAFAPTMALFSPLTSVADDGTISYVQAESVTSDDATVWTITLRDGWTFHNGEPVTAQSYVDAWNYEALSTNAWENAGQLAGIEGYDAVHPDEGDPTAETLSGLAIVDDLTFTVTLSAPDSSFPMQLSDAQTGFYPMPEAAYDDLDAYDRAPIGNGPFEMVDTWQDNTEFTMEAYADYAGTPAGVDEVVFRPYTDMDTAYTDVLAGNADLLYLPSDKYTSADADFGDHLFVLEAPGIDYLGFPLWDEQYSDKRVRQAISMAIDRDAVNDAIYGGIYEPATAYTPPIMDGTPEGICGEYCEFDPDAAKALLAEAGGFEGSIEIDYPGGLGLDDLFEAYANQIRQNLGVDAVAVPSTDWAEYWQTLVDSTVTGPHFGHWGALYTSQQNTLRALFTTSGGCTLCTGQYSNDEVDSLLAQADAAATTDEAAALYAQAQTVVMEDFPIVPTFFDSYAYVTSAKIAELPSLAGSPVTQQIELASS